MSYQAILSYGIFFYPSWRHYGREVNVVCDRCQTQQLTACIGHMQQDLCMSCVDELTRNCGTSIGFPPTRLPVIQPMRPPIGFHPSRPPINPHDYFDDCK